MYGLLQGLRIVEGASFIAGPSCALYLAQMGAEVIRFDDIAGGPDFRRWPLAPNGRSLYWEGLNKAKKSVAIDLSRPEGRALAQRLATAPGEAAGLFVTNFSDQGFLSYERLRALRNDLICVRVLGWADGKTGVDYTINAAVGVPLMTGFADQARPINHVLPAWDLLAGAYAAFTLVSALMARRGSGLGQHILIPLSDVAASSLANIGMVAETLSQGRQRHRMGNDLYGAFGRDFCTSDGKRVMLVAITPKQWSALVKALDLSASISQIETTFGISFAGDEGNRFRHRQHIFPLVESACAKWSFHELADRLDANGACWSQYQSMERALEDPSLFAGNDIFQDVEHPSGMRYPTPGAAATIAKQKRAPISPAPILGADTDEVLSSVLGLSPVEIAKLHDAHIVAGPVRG